MCASVFVAFQSGCGEWRGARVLTGGSSATMSQFITCHFSIQPWHVYGICHSVDWPLWRKSIIRRISFAYITGLSANQSALSKHGNPNRVPGPPRLMSNTLGQGPTKPPSSNLSTSHQPAGSHWLAVIGCIKHSADFLIILHMVTHGLEALASCRASRAAAPLDLWLQQGHTQRRNNAQNEGAD